jgi:plastocyanin
MKKFAVLLAMLLAALALVACGGGSSSTEGTSPAAGAAEEAEETAEEAGEEAEEKGEEIEKEAEGGSASSSSVSIEANPEGNLEFVQKSATAKAGEVTVDFANASPVPHDVAIEDSSGKTLGQTEVINGGSDSTEINLKPGTYTFYCTIPGHREAGMEGTLTVK